MVLAFCRCCMAIPFYRYLLVGRGLTFCPYKKEFLSEKKEILAEEKNEWCDSFSSSSFGFSSFYFTYVSTRLSFLRCHYAKRPKRTYIGKKISQYEA